MTTFKTLLLAAAVLAPAAIVAPAAQAQVSGIAVADPQGAIAASKAWTTARGQIETTYKAQLDQAETRRQAIARELQPLVTAFQTAQRAQQYVIEQIQAKLGDAVTNAVRAKNVTLLLRPDAALFAQPAADITTSITAELDRLVPTVGITPPAGWQPNQQGQQGGAAAAPAAPARGAPARTQPQGR